ncbi:energy-coupling factor transporter transmembrane component T family protein [Corynebacterium sp. A21]|uniref:energy-coupling factor transporter transmembrane component T family protein n=1 Tax=Corynebacterium sp. A21 TaxID=3457318 RepID=UPI003FD2A1F2
MTNPLTWLMAAMSTWILVLGVNQPSLSVTVLVVAQLIAVLQLRSLAVPAATLALAIPVGLSMLLVHAPFGTEPLFWVVTLDGLQTAGELSLRFVALMSAFLTAAAAITVPELAKAAQGHRWLGSRLAYILGSAVQLLPQGRDALAAVRDANKLRGRPVRGPVKALRFVAVPLITTLLTNGAARAIPLEVAGLDRRGPRTVLRPVPDPMSEKLLRWLLPLAAVGVVLWG